ncbi:hypothetical protein [Ferrovibrio sp.]|uniref:hypothetical protein n=1 Tax=Ferrovibrio sp. TaxID=1917215 RepID=UPI0035ADA28E
MTALAYHNYPTVTLVGTVALAAATDGTVTPIITGIPKSFRVVKARVVFDDMGSAQTADIGFNGGDTFFDGIDTGTAAGSATWEPADSAGVVNTSHNASITFKNIGPAATGDVRLEVVGYLDYTV